MNGTNMLKGMVAGLTATVVLSALMAMKSLMGPMPELNSVAMLTNMMGASSPVVGWVAHFVIGAVIWGGLFAWLNANIPGGSQWLKGPSSVWCSAAYAELNGLRQHAGFRLRIGRRRPSPERDPGVAAIAPQKLPAGTDMPRLWLLSVDGGEAMIREYSPLTS